LVGLPAAHGNARRQVSPSHRFFEGTIEIVHVLKDETYEQVSASVALPGIDVLELAAFLDRPSTSQALRDYREQIRP